MIKKIVPITLLSLLSTSAYSAVETVTSSFGTINAVVSSVEPNIIHVKNDAITNITAKSGAVMQETGTDDGSVIFSTSETKPFSIVIETEKGFTFNLRATPSEKAASNPIVISNLSDKGSKPKDDEIESFAAYQNYSGLIAHIFTELINNRIPEGFVDTSRTKFEIHNSMKNTFKVKNTDAWVGRGMRVVKLDITNISPNTLELNERYFWAKNVMAITFYPQVYRFPPNTRVFAYVMLKEVE